MILLGPIAIRGVTAQERSRPVDQHKAVNSAPRAGSSAGETLFAANCAGCHGLDGQGSERAPGIAGSARVQGLSDDRLFNLISNGIPGSGMPAFQALGEDNLREVVGFVRSLEGKHATRSLPGDTARGKEVFFGKGECSTCHTIYGVGGFLGPDLSTYGPGASAQAILDTILSTDRVVPAGYRLAIVTTRDGNCFEGIIRNEDNFSLQLQTKDGSFHFFQKSKLQSVEHRGGSLMPADYRRRLSSDELNDLVNYLVNGGVVQDPSRTPQDHEDEDESK